MAKLTITEALAEIKTVDKRIAKKREFIGAYLFRQEQLKDPLEKEGGSVAAVRSARDSIRDLETRKVALRLGITRANAETSVTIGADIRSVAEWLVWRRDVAPGHQQFLTATRQTLDRLRADAMKKGLAVMTDGAATRPTDVVVCINEKQIADEAEALEETLGTLDGQLSLKNATVFVEI